MPERGLSKPARAPLEGAPDRRWDGCDGEGLCARKSATPIAAAAVLMSIIRCGEWTERSMTFDDRRPTSARSRPPFPELGRVGLVDLPIEEIVVAGPRMDQTTAHFAGEAAGTPG